MKQAYSTAKFAMSHSRSLQLSIPLALVSLVGASSIASAAVLCVNPGGTAGCRATIGAAVAAANAYDTIKVSPGTYKEEVIITKPLSLVAVDQTAAVKPIIDATGLANGIFINGMSNAPYNGVENVLIAGFDVRNANFEGILVANVDNATIANNHVHLNDKGLVIPPPPVSPANPVTCPGLPAFETNEQADCGEGIHLIATTYSSVVRNESDHNSGGMLFTDETGFNNHNVVSENMVHDNPYACGITMASHAAYATGGNSYGVSYNTISSNMSYSNGLGLPAAGAGVGIFAPGPGTYSYGHVVVGNALYNNGGPGVAMHNHASFPPPVPGVHFGDSSIIGNTIYGNATDIGIGNASHTGISIFSMAAFNGTIISQNTISEEEVGIFVNTPSGVIRIHQNNFPTSGVGLDNLGNAAINATDNYWGCAGGPGTTGCSTITGAGVKVTPSLTAAF